MKTDPITLELFKNALFSIADEMAVTICRTTYSGVLRDNMDFSTGFADGQGNLVAQGLTIPLHLGSTPTALRAVLDTFGDDINPGDMFILNDPYDGGMHLPDIFIFQPIFIEDERMAFGVTVCHHADVGGRVPGSNASDSTEIFQEGIRIPPLKLFERGRRNDTLWRLIETNVRIPVMVTGDLRAQLAACSIAEQQFRELVAQHGLEATRHYMGAVVDYAERMARAGIRELPDGEWSFEDWIDDDGIDVGQPIRLLCTVIKHGDQIKMDWAGSSEQVKGAINATLSFTKAVCYAAVRSVLEGDIPCNEGLFRTIEVTAPEGTIVNMVKPGACAARGLTGFRMGDCAFGALAMMLPDRVMAASDGGNSGISLGGYDAERNPYIFVDFACGSWGARPWADGVQGNSNMFANMACQSVEVIEAENPLQVRAFEFVADRAGPGKFRGGAPYRRAYRFLEREAVLQVRSDRQTHRPFGLYGGRAGAGSSNVLNPPDLRPGGQGEPLPSKLIMTLRHGDVFSHVLPGGGGWGNPFERDPALVLDDVRNEFVTPEHAREAYGVVVDTDTWSVDDAETARLRATRADGGAADRAVNWE
ncbi:MAG: hydantoinase B/oxoprolinase family protein [Pseudomonadota bacterium]